MPRRLLSIAGCLVLFSGCTPSEGSGGESTDDTGTMIGPGTVGTSSSVSSAGSAGVSSTTVPNTTSEDSGLDESSDTADPVPDGPRCSVEVTTWGELVDPLPKGADEGVFPIEVGNALEDYCGCHTLEGNTQNLEHEGLRAPGGTLILEFADLQRGFRGGTLGQAFEAEVLGFTMPPGSCSFPSSASAVFRAWFAQGMPDGASYSP